MVVYSDAAGNKYLGDCQWGNHDINYPSTNFLRGVGGGLSQDNLLSDISDIFTAINYPSFYVIPTYPTATTFTDTLWSFQPFDGSLLDVFYLRGYHYIGAQRPPTPGFGDPSLMTLVLSTNGQAYQQVLSPNPIDYVVTCGVNSMGFLVFNYNTTYTAQSSTLKYFAYWGKLENVNTNYSYYSNNANHSILLGTLFSDNSLTLPSIRGLHYIVSAPKTLLETGRAAYTISCSDGQTPGSQWATDMWVYDNNAELGYPVIGRVPNMLLGIGTYTYLKPVKIQGSVFPDNGSPWYLPVGTFSGKTLLMRCYSSMT